MARVIAIANQKGGVGKTTTAVNLGTCIAELGRRVLVVDVDPQGNATSGLGLDRKKVRRSIYDALINNVPLREIVCATAIRGLDTVPSTLDLAGAEIELVAVERRETRLRQAVEGVRGDYEFIFMDCPPSLGLLTLNALTAADSILVPIQCEYYALEGLGQLMRTVARVQQHLNPGLVVEGVVLTMFDGRTNLSIQVAEEVKRYFRSKVYRTVVPRNVRLSEAPSHGKPITLYDSRSRGADVYKELAKEVTERAEKRTR
ncbi:MAG: ParA family protein [Firmicutes bacterium]|nr:ParA family protein [Bacillota bacterium]